MEEQPVVSEVGPVGPSRWEHPFRRDQRLCRHGWDTAMGTRLPTRQASPAGLRGAAGETERQAGLGTACEESSRGGAPRMTHLPSATRHRLPALRRALKGRGRPMADMAAVRKAVKALENPDWTCPSCARTFNIEHVANEAAQLGGTLMHRSATCALCGATGQGGFCDSCAKSLADVRLGLLLAYVGLRTAGLRCPACGAQVPVG